MLRSGSTLRKLGVLWALYFAEGLPFGFQVTALPVYLRAHGFSLTGIGLASALSLPWMLKALWAPAVDRFGSARFGRRRTWILPAQVALAGVCCAAAWVADRGALAPLLALVFAMNLCAATMDIAVDGLAVDLLDPAELGHGNVAQVVGYKLGMLTGGGLLLWASAGIGWNGLFLAMAALLVPVMGVAWRFREPAAAAHPAGGVAGSLGGIVATVLRRLRPSGSWWLLLFIATYKFGETMADAMFKPFLYDAGYRETQIGLWVGTWGMLFSMSGSFAGGLLASRLASRAERAGGDGRGRALLQAVGWTAILRVAPLIGHWWLAVSPAPAPGPVIAVTSAEHFFGGALTTAMFAYMMSRVDRRIGATHYTLLATVEVLGKSPGAWLSGVIADLAGYPVLFGLAVVLSAMFLLLLLPLRARRGLGRSTTG